MIGKYFTNTNIFVYSFDNENADKRDISLKILEAALTQSKGIISYQVIQEFLNAAMNKFKVPLRIDDCSKYLTVVLDPLCEARSNVDLYHKAIEVVERWQYSFYDSLIIAAAIQSECKLIYYEDLQHGQKIFNLEIVNPFIKWTPLSRPFFISFMV